MTKDTKERILEIAIGLFAQKGYLGTSMSDIACRLGITKAALYKHYESKQAILNSIVDRMNKNDYDRAGEYEMPKTEPDGLSDDYKKRRLKISGNTLYLSLITGQKRNFPRISGKC